MSTTDLDRRLGGVAAKLRAAAQDGFRPFGVEGHGSEIRPPLAARDIAAFEGRFGVTLPAEYRGFLTRVADGGAGPAYGLNSLEAALPDFPLYGPIPADFLRTPFPHTAPYNPDTDPDVRAVREQAERGDIPVIEEYRQELYLRAGTLSLCHEGCGYMHFLVVTGPARGEMWIDGRCSDGGFAPFGVGFLDWYERWLDDTLAGGDGVWWMREPGG